MTSPYSPLPENPTFKKIANSETPDSISDISIFTTTRILKMKQEEFNFVLGFSLIEL
jgi:hypothetical protein